jgi:hypothetical protein
MLGRHMIEDLLPANGTLRRRRSDDHDKQESQHIRGDAPFPAFDLLPASIP